MLVVRIIDLTTNVKGGIIGYAHKNVMLNITRV